jgi:hypothetical protein
MTKTDLIEQCNIILNTHKGIFLNTTEFAKIVGRSAYTVRELCKFGILNASMNHKKPRTGQWEIPLSEVERWGREGPFQISRKQLSERYASPLC